MIKSLTLLYALSFCFWIFGQPANDNPCGAIALTVNNFCNLVSYSTSNSTNSTNGLTITNPSCAGYSGRDVWFSFTVPATGNFQVSTSAGSITDGGMSLYTALDCGGIMTQLECDDDDGPGSMPRITRMGMTPGQTIYVRVWQNGGGTGSFRICVMSLNNCGSANNNDNCPSPATLFPGTGSFHATTDGTFTDDKPGNLNDVFCGSIENNSWYRFTATATTHSFPITYVGGCENNQGIQAHVYQVTTNSSGCCTNFVSKSNCYNPANLTLGTVNATGLDVGQQYLLMIDGYAGDGCEFTISGWTAINVLPIELVEFSGSSEVEGIMLQWSTESETNNDYFQLLHSTDGLIFSAVGNVPSKGNSSELKSYSFLHENPENGTNYYKLKQVDLNGSSKESATISVYNSKQEKGFKLSPNPANDHVKLTFYSESNDDLTFSVFNFQGQEVERKAVSLEKGATTLIVDMSSWNQGVYTVLVSTKSGVQTHKLIKD